MESTQQEFPSFPPDCPLRLAIAAKIAFPDGSMTASGLRREAQRGRLVVERIAGKDYTTLADIQRMRELCRVKGKALDCGSDRLAENAAEPLKTQSGLSLTATSISPRDALSIK